MSLSQVCCDVSDSRKLLDLCVLLTLCHSNLGAWQVVYFSELTAHVCLFANGDVSYVDGVSKLLG